MSLFAEYLRNMTPMATLSIRKLSHLPAENPVYAYEITETGHAAVRGTVDYRGPENLELAALVLTDYISRTPQGPIAQL
jgi:hypothetical protein